MYSHGLIALAYIAMAYIAMAYGYGYILMVCIVMACIGMAYIVMAQGHQLDCSHVCVRGAAGPEAGEFRTEARIVGMARCGAILVRCGPPIRAIPVACVRACVGAASLHVRLACASVRMRHNYIGHNYIVGHHFVGHSYIGHHYIGHECAYAVRAVSMATCPRECIRALTMTM